jgi:hypothetical protein
MADGRSDGSASARSEAKAREREGSARRCHTRVHSVTHPAPGSRERANSPGHEQQWHMPHVRATC